MMDDLLEALRRAEAAEAAPEELIRGFRVERALEALRDREARRAMRWLAAIGAAAAALLLGLNRPEPEPAVRPAPAPPSWAQLWNRARAGDRAAERALRPVRAEMSARVAEDPVLSARILARCRPARHWGPLDAVPPDRFGETYAAARSIAPADARRWLATRWGEPGILAAVAPVADAPDARAVALNYARLPRDAARQILTRHRATVAPLLASRRVALLEAAADLAWPELVPALSACLDDPASRASALEALAATGGPRALEAILSRWETLGLEAADALERFGDPAIDALLALAPRAKGVAACLGRFDSDRATEALVVLARLDRTRREALEALARRPGEAPARALVGATLEGRLDRETAGRLLKACGPERVTPLLIRALDQDRTRDRAHRALIEITGRRLPARSATWASAMDAIL